ncbi:MAG: DUF892 family protein [Panacibacter sp.]
MANTKKATGKSPQAAMAKGANNSILQEFFGEEIKDIYYAEKQIIKTLPKMMKEATSPELKQAFQEHFNVTKTQVSWGTMLIAVPILAIIPTTVTRLTFILFIF